MTIPAVDVDQVLKALATQSIKQGGNVRTAVRDLTLKAMQQRELSLEQIRKVLRSVTEGVSLGVAKRESKVEKALSDTVAGMDDALLKAVEASNLALHRLTGEGYDYEDSNLRQALVELEKLEDEFLESIAKAAESAGERIQAPWERVLRKTRLAGTTTGTQVTATLRDYAKRAQTAMRAQREMGFKTAHLLTQNFATLASGILIGMSEGLGAKRVAARRTTTPVKKPKAARAARRTTPKAPKAAKVKAKSVKRPPAAKRAVKKTARKSR